MLGTGVGTAIDGGAQGRSGEACRWSRRTQRKFHGAAARRPLPWSPPCTLSLCKEKWRQVLAFSLPPAQVLQPRRRSPYQYALALRFVRDARDGATANVTVAIATASDLGPGAAGTAGAAATGGGNQPALASSRGARVRGAAQQPSSCTHAGKASRHVAQTAR